MRILGPVAATVVAMVAVAGLVHLHERPPNPPGDAEIAAGVDCLDPGMFPGRFPPPTAQTFTPPSTGSVPDNFIPVAVVSCEPTFGRSRLDANGNPVGTEVTVDEVRHAGDLTALLSALSEDSDPQGW